jgi:hypothetical protein
VGRLLLAILTACALSGCIDWGSLYEDSDAGSTGDDSAPDSDGPPNLVGCSDGSAEALLATSGLAACAGAWSVPGVVDETEPTCDRTAGNGSENSSGEGCSVADLCAVGWHVCRDAADVAAHGGEEACTNLQPPEPDGGELFIYVTRQRGGGDLPTCDPDGSEDERGDDVWGCGTLGLEAPDCRPLDRHLALEVEEGGCGELYQCGDDSLSEGRNVTKVVSAEGAAALCCSDSDP